MDSPVPLNVTQTTAIAVMTSGGDAQGMNPAVRSIVRSGIVHNCKVFAIMEGYQGLVDGNIQEQLWDDVSGLLSAGGTVLGTSRCMSFQNDPAARRKCVYNLVKLGIDRLICIGGDGSLTGMYVLKTEWGQHLKKLVEEGLIDDTTAKRHSHLYLVGLVGSIDNDMCGTDITIGADSALHRIVEALDAIMTTASSHQRMFVVEVMGRNCGFLALMAGIAVGADWIFIPEQPPKRNWKDRLAMSLLNRRKLGARHNVVIVSEGAVDFEGNKITTSDVKKTIEERTGLDTRITILGHVQRGGVPSAYDRTIGTLQGIKAVEIVLTAKPDDSPQLVGSSEGHKITCNDLMDSVRKTKTVGKALEAKNWNLAFSQRDPMFVNCWSTFRTLARAFPHTPDVPGLNFAILHVGAPSPGMNPCVRAVVRLATDKGHNPIAFYNGFQGLFEDDGIALQWRSVANWAAQAGAFLGTNRVLPKKVGLERICQVITQRKIHGIVIIGGWEGYVSAMQLWESQSKYPALKIPVVVIPATISNNCPGSEYSIGTDTALNVIVDASDRVKRSATSSRRRVFIMECMGGQCGYLPLLGAIAGGAQIAYLPEIGVNLKQIAADAERLKSRFVQCRSTSLIMNAERSSDTYDTRMLNTIFKEESSGRYDVRSLILGHIQQGNVPSPRDRIQAASLAHKVIDFLEGKCLANDAWVGTVGLVNGAYSYKAFPELLEEMDFENRRPKSRWWMEWYSALNLMRGRPSDDACYRPLASVLFPDMGKFKQQQQAKL